MEQDLDPPQVPIEPGDEDDTEGHRLASNDDESIVDDDDTEGHRLASNDDESIVVTSTR